MESNFYTTTVEMPNKKRLNVDFYFSEENGDTRKEKQQLNLLIQFDDCISQMKIERSVINDLDELERIVHNKVINEKWHLC
ncbi:MAG TPA: hypothetical protein VFT78_14350 [Hanamia sp.]|nr:hypothetical protein [Hanamia sp.]